MIHYIIASHGLLAEGMVSAIKLITGEKDSIYNICAYIDESSPEEKLNSIMSKFKNDDYCILLSDMEGSSIHQLLFRQLNRPRTFLVAGYNLSLIIEIILTNACTVEEIEAIVKENRKNMKLVELVENNIDQEDNFFN